MSTRLTIGHGNGHNRPELVEWARRTGRGAKAWDSFSGNETQRLTAELSKLGRITVADGTAQDRVRSTCLITSRDRGERYGQLSLRIAEAMPEINLKLHPARALAASYYGHPIAAAIGARGVAHFTAHPPPTVMKHAAGHPVVRAYAGALETVREEMRAARAAGYLLILTGDLQAGAHYAEAWGPRGMIADRLDLRCRVEHIDWIMIDAELQFDGPLQLHELYDHTGFIANMVPA